MGEYLDRLVFMVLSGNGDAHLKNWGILYPDRRHPVLSPAYDLVSTVLYRWHDELALSLGDSRRFEEVDEAKFASLAPRIRWSPNALLQHIRRARERILDIWRSASHDLGLTEEEHKRLERHHARTPLARRE